MWESVQEMVDDLGLKADPTNRDALASELRQRQAQLHPDNDGGEFRSEEVEEKYHRVREAREFLKEGDAGALIPVEAATELVEAVSRSLPDVVRESPEERAAELQEREESKLTRRVLGPKITLAGVTAALSYVLIFPNQFVDHPMFGWLVPRYKFRYWWLGALMFLVFLWVIVFLAESRMKATLERLFSRGVHTHVFDHLRGYDLISRSEIGRELHIRVVGEGSWLSVSKMLGRIPFLPRVPQSAIEDATQVAIDRYKDRGWIKREKQPPEERLDDWYRVMV